MNLATGEQPIYTGRLSKDKELYVTRDSLVVISEEKGKKFETEIGHIRCAFPYSDNIVRIYWRTPKQVSAGKPLLSWHRYHQDFELDLKAMFHDKKQRQHAEKTETKNLAGLILQTIQEHHSLNNPNTKGYIAMHTGEYVIGAYEAQCKFGNGELIVTNLGVYFTSFRDGLCLDMPFDMLDAYDNNNKTVKIHYFEPFWEEGYELTTKKNRSIEIRINDEQAQKVCDDIARGFSDGGAQEIRALANYMEKFGNMTPDELFREIHTGKTAEENDIGDYMYILAKRKWGEAPTPLIYTWDENTVRACLCTGVPLDAAGGLTDIDRKYRKDITDYSVRGDKLDKELEPLIADFMKIVTENIDEDEKNRVGTTYTCSILDDFLKETVRTGTIAEDFLSETAVKELKWEDDFNKLIVENGLAPMHFERFFKIPPLWSKEEAERILADRDYQTLRKLIREKLEEFDPIHKGVVIPQAATYARTFSAKHMNESVTRSRKIYDEWTKTVGLTEYTDPTVKDWIEYLLEILDEDKEEMRRAHYGAETETFPEMLRKAILESNNTKTMLQRIVIPDGIAKEDIYVDAWYDKARKSWFTTSTYKRIEDTDKAVMTPDMCEQKFATRATVFSEDLIEMKHGFPAVYDDTNKWWVLLSTIPDEKITELMVKEKRCDDSLRYNVQEPNIVILENGDLGPMTEKEFYWTALLADGLEPIPLNERIRRLLFYTACNCVVNLNEADMLQYRSKLVA